MPRSARGLRARAATALCTALCTAFWAAAPSPARAGERIYESRSPGGMAVYTNVPREGASLLMTLPPARVRAAWLLDESTGTLSPLQRPPRMSAHPQDPVVRSLIEQAARRHDLDADLLTALIRQESGFNPLAVSRAGARGLMQLMPATARRYGVSRIHDPGENIAGGSAYLRDLLDRFGRIDLALAAYNAGEGAVQKYGNRIPPYNETRHYVAVVMADYRWRKQQR